MKTSYVYCHHIIGFLLCTPGALGESIAIILICCIMARDMLVPLEYFPRIAEDDQHFFAFIPRGDVRAEDQARFRHQARADAVGFAHLPP